MTFTDIFIKRPVLATVISLILFLVGLVSYLNLHVREFPEIETSVITVSTAYPGASAQLMEGFVATPLENAIAGIDGIDHIESSSSQGSTRVKIFLKQGYDINVVINDVSDKVASIRGKLPSDVKDPVIAKSDPNANPTVYITFNSDRLSKEALTDYIIRLVQPEIQTVSGVGEIMIFGKKEYAMRVWLNPLLMAAHQVTAGDVATALQTENIQAAAGRIESQLEEYNITAKTDLHTEEQFDRLVIKQENNRFVRLADIGKAVLGPTTDRFYANINGKPTIVMALVPKSTANPLLIAKDVNTLLPAIKKKLPPGIQASIVWDSSKFIAESISEVYKTILEACLFVVIVIFLFLGSLRAVFIPAVTIPLSLIGVCALMLAFGFTLNTLTLLAWVLAIGMVVDDAIVVLENIHRHIEEGMPPLKAALQGAREIRFAVLAMTLTLAAVYAPIGFMTGLTGTLFREFAFTLAGAVIISGFLALTLSPMLCRTLLRDVQHEGGLSRFIDTALNRLREGYRYVLTHFLRFRWLILVIGLAIYGGCAWLWLSTPKELAPTEDQGAILGLAFGPTASNLAYTRKYTAELQKIYESVPEREGFGIINGFPQGVNSALSFLILKPWSERQRSASDIKQSLFGPMWSIPGMMMFPSELPPLPGSGGNTPIEFVLKTTSDYVTLNNAMQKVLAYANQNPGLLNPRSDLTLNKPQVDINVDRDKAADLGISMRDIGYSLSIFLAEPDVSRFIMAGRSYDVIPQLYAQFRDTPEKLKDLYVRTRSGDFVTLGNVVQVSTQLAPERLQHFQQLRAAKLTANLAPGYTLGQAISDLTQFAKTQLPSTMQYDFGGQSRQYVQASNTMAQTFIFALIFIYLILAAQFESFRDPLIVMTSVPLSLTGALLAMHWTGATMNIYTQIGLVTLVGLISKHGILMVEFANQLQLQQGYDKFKAIVEAAATRLRPILMTTAAMILGATPLALASGAGAVSRSQMGWVIVGGMSIGTLFTLFVVPSVYAVFAKSKNSDAGNE